MRSFSPFVLLVFLSAPFQSAVAGRPLGTDDAGTVGHLKYQVEAWQEHGEGAHGNTVAPAFGLGDFEFGLETARSREAEGVRARETTLALKWAPENLSLGPVRFGAKAWTGRSYEKNEEESSKARENGAIAIASWSILESLSAHFNLGVLKDNVDRQTRRLANAALSWTPHENLLFFIEAMNQQSQPTTQSLGMRYWAIPEKLGIDLTVSRQAGNQNSNTIGIGFGWYGSLSD